MFKLADGREVEIDHAVEGVKYNAYGCPGAGQGTHMEAGHVVRGTVAHYILSMDVDEGVTPMMLNCPDHPAMAESMFYPADIVMRPSLWPVQVVWRKATNGELKRERREHGDHYSRGGLAREWTGAKAPERPSWLASGRHG